MLQLDKSLDIELKELQEKKKKRDAIMKALHHYNNIKDTTQIVLGQLAILEGVTVAEIHRKYNLLESDWLLIEFIYFNTNIVNNVMVIILNFK